MPSIQSIKIGKAPEIPIAPEKAFFPISSDLKGVHYSWRDVKIFRKDVRHEVKYLFEDQDAMSWFNAQDYGFCKRPSP